jgi:hypothetical protein
MGGGILYYYLAGRASEIEGPEYLTARSKKSDRVGSSGFHLGGVAGGDFDYWDAGGVDVGGDSEGDGGGKKGEGEGGVEYWGIGNWQDPNIRVSVIALSTGPNKIVDGSAVNSSKCDDIFSWR